MRHSSIVRIGILMPACLGLFWGCFAVPDGTDPTGPSGGGPGTPGGGSGGDATHGAALYADRGCSACHAQDGSGGFGPSLLSVDLATLDMMLRDPGTSHPGGLFADLTDQDLEDLLAFLAPVVTDTPDDTGTGDDGGETPGDGGGTPSNGSDSAANGASIFAAEGCTNCHGADGSGGFGPSLLSVDFATLDAKLRDPAVSHGGGKFSHLTDQDLTDLVNHLAPASSETPGGGGDSGGDGTTPPGGGGDAASLGAAIFAAEGCVNCHGADGSGGIGPSLLSVDFSTLNAKLRDLAVGHGGGKFPHLTDPDLNNLVAFLGSSSPPDDPDNPPPPPFHRFDLGNSGILHGEGYLDPFNNCVVCHSSTLEGDPSLMSPACWSCHGSLWDGAPDYPPTHTDSEHGFMHKPGKNNPVGNCDACHGTDLMGTDLIPSCFQCHGQKWGGGGDDSGDGGNGGNGGDDSSDDSSDG